MVFGFGLSWLLAETARIGMGSSEFVPETPKGCADSTGIDLCIAPTSTTGKGRDFAQPRSAIKVGKIVIIAQRVTLMTHQIPYCLPKFKLDCQRKCDILR